MKTKKAERRRQSQGSFTLIETVVALAIITFLVLEVSAVQGNSIVFSDYGRNVTQATWLAKRVMSQVEYFWRSKPFTELETETKDGRFEDNEEYQYAVDIKEWKFPFLQLLQSTMGGGPKEEGEEKSEEPADAGLGKMLETVVDQVFGKEPIFMTALVTVSWSEGAQRNSTTLMYLLTNQAKLDEAIVQLKPVWDRLTKPPAKKKNDKPKTPPAVDPNNPNPEQPPVVDPNADPNRGTDP